MGGRGEAEENGREEEEVMKGCRFEDVENVGQIFEYPMSVQGRRPEGWCTALLNVFVEAESSQALCLS
jgi:hypothetical protein